jgi:hypothetical protein
MPCYFLDRSEDPHGSSPPVQTARGERLKSRLGLEPHVGYNPMWDDRSDFTGVTRN